jgi:hypothetical protein
MSHDTGHGEQLRMSAALGNARHPDAVDGGGDTIGAGAVAPAVPATVPSATSGAEPPSCQLLVTRRLRGHADSVTCCTSAGSLIATGSDDRTARLWDAHTLACVATCSGMRESVTAVLLAPATRSEATAPGDARRGGSAGAAHLLFAAAGSAIFEYAVAEPSAASAGAPAQNLSVWAQAGEAAGPGSGGAGQATAPAGAAAATAAPLPQVLQPKVQLRFNGDEVAALAYLPAPAGAAGPCWLAAADDDGVVCLIDAHSRKLLRSLRRGGHTSLCSSAVFLTQELAIGGAGAEGPAHAVGGAADAAAASAAAAPALPGGAAEIDIATGGFDHAVTLWDARTGTRLASAPASSPQELNTAAPAASPLPDAARSGTRARGSGGGGGSSARRRAPVRGKGPVAVPDGDAPAAHGEAEENGGGGSGQLLNPPFIHALAWHAGERLLAAARGDGKVSLWRITSRQQRRHIVTFEAHAAAATCASFVSAPQSNQAAAETNEATEDSLGDSGRGCWLATAGNDGRICVWDAAAIVAAAERRRTPAAAAPAHDAAEPASGGPTPVGTVAVAPIAWAPTPVWQHQHGRGPNALCVAAVGWTADAGTGVETPAARGPGETEGRITRVARRVLTFSIVVCDTRKDATVYRLQLRPGAG